MNNELKPLELKVKSSARERLIDYAPLWGLVLYIFTIILFLFFIKLKLIDQENFFYLANLVSWLVLISIIYFIWGVIGIFFNQKGSLPHNRSKNRVKGAVIAFIFTILVWMVGTLMTSTVGKPVIYLYPPTETDVTVQLDFAGKLIADYPIYDTEIGGWRVKAYPDGKILNYADSAEYSYLFWEGISPVGTVWNQNEGFVVAGSDTREFLQEKLAMLGLTPKEYNEFIVYWYPLMMNNPYNLITFAGKEYTDMAPLTITPTPDSILRVFMVFKPLQKKIDIQPQILEKFNRTGFTVVEWGGTEVK